jgi:hypothetical protein
MNFLRILEGSQQYNDKTTYFQTGGEGMSLKHYAILLKAFGLAIFLVPLFMKGMGYIATISQSMVFGLIVIGAILLMAGNVFEAKALRADTPTRRGEISKN